MSVSNHSLNLLDQSSITILNGENGLIDKATLKVEAKRLAIECTQRIHEYGLSSCLNLVSLQRVKEPAGKPFAQVLRLKSEFWWLSRLRKRNLQDVEQAQRVNGFVSKQTSPYVSKPILATFRAQRINSEESLKSKFIINESTGERVSLYDIAQTTNANPEIRRAELMVRIAGTEELASENGDNAVFLTITAPSKYHAISKKYSGASAVETQEYLKIQWGRARKSFDRLGLNPYGFRVVEPHHDGTPHWHLLLWIKPSDKPELIRIMKALALKEDGSEPGASKHRFTVEEIDSEKGSAAGYIAKYISKNIDGHGIDQDEEAGIDAATGAERVRTWASVNDIRQFQSIGCASVSVWRELRRMKTQPCGLIEDMHRAAVTNNYAEYLRLQGGVNVSTKTQRVKLASCAVGTNHYGEEIRKPYALVTDEVAEAQVLLNRDSWVLDCGVAFDCESEASWSPLNKCLLLDTEETFDIQNQLIEMGLISSIVTVENSSILKNMAIYAQEPSVG